MVAPVLIFAVGNESRGDDGLGPLLLRELQAYLHANGDAHGFELLEEFQRELTFAFSTGNFNPVKIYCQKVKERIEFMERKYKEEHARTKGENQKPEVKVPQVKHRNRYFPE